MSNREQQPSFSGHEKKYFEWSWQGDPPEVWETVERPALVEGIKEARRLLESLFGVTEPKVLDLGVGAAKVVNLLLELGIPASDITAVDSSPEMVRLAQEKFPAVDIRVEDITAPDFPEALGEKGPFHIVTASLVLNHLDNTQVWAALENIYAMVPDGAFFLALIPNPNNRTKEEVFAETEEGYVMKDQSPWGGEVIYHHRNFMEYYEYFEFAGFSPRVAVVDWKERSRRVLITGRKNVALKEELKKYNMGIELIKGQYKL